MKVVSATREKIVLKPYRKDITQESFIFDLGGDKAEAL